MSTPAPLYRETLSAPLRWWVQGTLLVASLWLALIVAIPSTAAWILTGVALGLLALFLLAYGSVRIEVTEDEFRAGRAHIATRHLAGATPLDREETRHLAGPGADVRAHLVLRPYRHRSVRVDLADPRDPTPYWLVSTRHPERLAEAVARVGSTVVTPHADAPAQAHQED